MCGVAGSLGWPGSTSRLLEGVAHRGPEQQALVAGKGPVPLELGAARLRVKGGPEQDMPLVSASGRTLLAVNGEVFNHARLLGPGQAGDLVGLAEMLEQEGPAVLARLRGPFALLALDQGAGTLLLARDQHGVRPLFYRCHGQGVAAASEVAPLRRLDPQPGRDEEAWDHLLALQFWPPGRSLYRGLRAVEPGQWIRFKLDQRGRLFREEGRICFKGAAGSPREQLARAFRLQGPVNRKSGLLLSGGLDSSAVAGMLAAVGCPPDLAAVGWFPEAPEALDERPHARAVARELGLPLLEVPIRAASWLAAWPRLLAVLGGPLAGPGGPAQWLVAQALAREGVSVVYSGTGGDEFFGGYERHRLLLQRDRGEVGRAAPGYEPLEEALQGASPLHGLLFRGRPLLPFLEPSRAQGVLRAAKVLPGPGPRLASRALAFERHNLLPGLLLVEDAAAAAFGMEGRAPLLDPGLTEAVGRLPLEELSPPEAPRRFFRELLGDRLPTPARRRQDKMGFPPPLKAWVLGPFRELFKSHPGWQKLRELGFKPSVQRAALSPTLPPRLSLFLLGLALCLDQEAPASLETVP